MLDTFIYKTKQLHVSLAITKKQTVYSWSINPRIVGTQDAHIFVHNHNMATGHGLRPTVMQIHSETHTAIQIQKIAVACREVNQRTRLSAV